MFRCFRQLEYSDCGLSCVRMIARHYGVSVPMRHLREITDLTRAGMSVKDIVDCCRSIGLDSAPVKIGIEEARRMPLPAILYWQQRHFVVLYKIRRNCFYVADPSLGRIRYNEQDFSNYWLPAVGARGLAVLAEPGESFHSRQYDTTGSLTRLFSYLFSFLKSHRRSFFKVLLISLVIMGADLAVPLLLRRTIDEGIGLRDIGLVLTLLLGQFAVVVGSLVSSSGMNLMLTRLGLRINMEMVCSYLTRLTRFPLSFFDRKVSSDFIQKINDQSQIRDFLVSFPNTVLVLILNLVVFSVLLVHYSPLIFAVFIAISVLEIGWSALFLNRRKTLNYALFTHSSENRNHAYELTNGMADLKVNNAEDVRVGKWKETQEKINSVSMRNAWLNMFHGNGQSVISRIKELTVTGLSAWLVINGQMTLGIMMTLGYITGRLAQPFNLFSSSLKSVQDSLLSYERIDDVLSDMSESRGDGRFSEPSISLEHVWFKYPGSASPFVIKDFTLDVEPGKITALVGESGCGKSTLIKLMLGFYIPQKGELALSGMPVSYIDNSDWLRHCGVVLQEGKLFTASILENLSLSEFQPDAVKAMKMLDTVGLGDFVRKLPMGLDTRLGVSGIELSGGQKQRLMIARALYKNPDILFLDEATSSLDANNERMIVENIREFGEGRTLIVAAHRLSTVRDADKIVFIKDGRIAECGTHEELIKLKGNYWTLVRNQLQLSL